MAPLCGPQASVTRDTSLSVGRLREQLRQRCYRRDASGRCFRRWRVSRFHLADRSLKVDPLARKVRAGDHPAQLLNQGDAGALVQRLPTLGVVGRKAGHRLVYQRNVIGHCAACPVSAKREEP
jgi:hypothetical protein